MSQQNPRRPVAVIVVACLYIGVGVLAFLDHFKSLTMPDVLRAGLWIELLEVIAVVTGVFLLVGRNWARWLALAWMAFHVVFSVYGPVNRLIVHSVFFVAIAWLLFREDTGRYFHPPRTQPS